MRKTNEQVKAILNRYIERQRSQLNAVIENRAGYESEAEYNKVVFKLSEDMIRAQNHYLRILGFNI
ncbi:hypothetical protein [Dyadobacter sp. BHUBP1]|uniref:hypothetical protein n=1 Tax=Dyadobacter sp. BHUBP1 TaxID=3424178 RepID=UPI003D32CAD7